METAAAVDTPGADRRARDAVFGPSPHDPAHGLAAAVPLHILAGVRAQAVKMATMLATITADLGDPASFDDVEAP